VFGLYDYDYDLSYNYCRLFRLGCCLLTDAGAGLGRETVVALSQRKQNAEEREIADPVEAAEDKETVDTDRR